MWSLYTGKQTGKCSSSTLPFVSLDPMSQPSCPYKNAEIRAGVGPTTTKKLFLLIFFFHFFPLIGIILFNLRQHIILMGAGGVHQTMI